MDGKVNVYERIVEECKKMIAVGAWRAGDKLPSVREYAIARKVNPNTVAKAYSWLEKEGLIQILPKKGAFVLSGNENKSGSEDLLGILRKWKEDGVEKTRIERLLNEVFEGGVRND